MYESDAFFTFHHINAYEEDDQIVVDVAAYDRGDVRLDLYNCIKFIISNFEITSLDCNAP